MNIYLSLMLTLVFPFIFPHGENSDDEDDDEDQDCYRYSYIEDHMYRGAGYCGGRQGLGVVGVLATP